MSLFKQWTLRTARRHARASKVAASKPQEQDAREAAPMVEALHTAAALPTAAEEPPVAVQAAPAAPPPAASVPTAVASRGRGTITGCDLSQLQSLTRPFARDSFYRLRPPFSREAAERSLELANMAYTLDIDPWVEAGWNDFSIQIDNVLQSGVTHGESASGERMRNALNTWKLIRAKAALNARNPVSQVLSALRQRERSDTIKAVCMMHPLPDGQYLLAIGFMGTGRRFYDWISNFRFTTEEGFHKGFHQLCRYFEESAESIVFPETAAELGLEKLTLNEVLAEMRSGSSRFRLWMAGHSQGAAVMQVFTHRLMTDWGVQVQNMVGYGFASPTVATGRLAYDPAAYPLYHLLNSDDMVTRMGAVLHLGLCLQYQANDAFRATTYGLSTLPADVAARDALRPYQLQMVDTASILLYSTAFLQCIAEEKGEESLSALMNKRWSIAPVDWLLTRAGGQAQSWLDMLVEHARNGYAAVMDRPMDERELTAIRDSMRPLVRSMPLRRLMSGVASYCAPPHHIMCDEQRERGAYAYLVQTGLSAVRPFIWVRQPNGAAVRRYAAVPTDSARPIDGLHLPAEQPFNVCRARRNPAPARALPIGKRRASLSARRALR